MKKCRKCGALQNDDRTQCVDCGALLGAPMNETEETRTDAALDDKLDQMADHAADFHVSLRDKIFGILAILCVIAAVVLLNLAGVEKNKIPEPIPDEMIILRDDISSAELTASRRRAALRRTLDESRTAALCAIIACSAAAPMLLAPRLMWNLDTLKYRLFYNWDTPPSWLAMFLRRGLTYVLFGGGVIAVIYGYYLYL